MRFYCLKLNKKAKKRISHMKEKINILKEDIKKGNEENEFHLNYWPRSCLVVGIPRVERPEGE